MQKLLRLAGHRPFQCQDCPATFCRKPYLDIHLRTHTGERPFECEICLKRFSQRSTLNIHKRIHTGQSRYQNLIRTFIFSKNNKKKMCKGQIILKYGSG
jgi:uncharacterized Zn-finger protein